MADKDPQWTAGESRVFPYLNVYVAVVLSAVFSETLFAAWKVNQPKPVFAEEREEAAEEDVL